MSNKEYQAVNVGCGDRFISSPDWQNLDFYAVSPEVTACNFLKGIPLPAGASDFVYSSHALEHFTKDQALELVREMARVLKTGGMVRIVVPDLEDVCAYYLRSLEARRDGGDKAVHDWAVIELIDQMVRQKAGGEMGRMFRQVRDSGDEDFRQLIIQRTGWDVSCDELMDRRTLSQKLGQISLAKIRYKLFQAYVGLVRRLIPRSQRMMVVDETPPGEKHKWMYDRESLTDLLEFAGFSDISFCCVDTSGHEPFLANNLDLKADGSPHKQASLYAEAIKPA